MKKENKNKGDYGEKLAVEYLLGKGYMLVEKNFRVGRLGEIDIIVEGEEYLIFVEVKFRNNLYYGYPSESVNGRKINKIHMLANIYINNRGLENRAIRFDVIEVLNDSKGSICVNHIKNAF